MEHYKDAKGWHSSSTQLKNSSTFKAVQVRTMDGALFLSQATRGSSFVAVKIDIEGHEYQVLRHALISKPNALCNLDLLVVEWHEALLTKEADIPANATAVFKWLLQGCPRVTVVNWK